MARIACLLADDFEDSEYRKPVDALRGRGHEVVVLGLESGKTVAGKYDREHVPVDDAIAKRSASQFDALLIPGGQSPARLRQSADAIAFCREFARTGRPIAAVCHGPQLLISAGLVQGRTMTSWPAVRGELEDAGAKWVDQALAVDGPFITSRNPGDLGVFSQALIDRLDREQRESAPSP